MGCGASQTVEMDNFDFCKISSVIKKRKEVDDIACMRYCYSILKTLHDNDGKDNIKKLEITVYCKNKEIVLLLKKEEDSEVMPSQKKEDSEEEDEYYAHVAMGHNQVPVCLTNLPCKLPVVEPEPKPKTEDVDKDKPEEEKSQKQPAPAPEFKGDEYTQVVQIECKKQISFRDIHRAKIRVTDECGVNEKDLACLNYCIGFIQSKDYDILSNAMFNVACGDDVMVVLWSGDQTNVYEIDLNEKKEPVVKAVGETVDESYKPGACGAPYVATKKEYGYQVITEKEIDVIVDEFKRWKLINRNDEMLLKYVKKVFYDVERDNEKGKCPDIKENVHLTVECDKFHLVLRAGKGYNICRVYMEGSTPKYKVQHLPKWRRTLEKLSTIKADKLLTDIRVGPLKLNLTGDTTTGEGEATSGEGTNTN